MATSYKFQVEIGAATNQDFYIEIVWFATLYCIHGDYPSAVTI